MRGGVAVEGRVVVEGRGVTRVVKFVLTEKREGETQS